MLDFAACPPEVNSGLMYTGPGSGPMLAAAAAWDVLATELYSTASSYGLAIADLASVWLGPSSISMAAAATPYVSWITATAGLAETTGLQAKAAVAAYETAFTMTVPPPVIAANRAQLMALIATNFFGQNTPAIMATEAQYMEMWAQDAAAMIGYAGASQTAATFTAFTPPPPTTNPGGVGAQAAAAIQAAGTSAGTGAQTVSPFTTAMPSALSSTMSAPLTTAAPEALPGFTSTATSMSSVSSMAPLSSTALTSSSTALTSGTGAAASMSTSGISAVGLTSSLMQSFGPTAGVVGIQGKALGFALGNGFGSGTGAFGPPSVGSTAVNGGVGRAASVGMLSVPQNWASAAPAFSQVGSALPATIPSAGPAVVPGGPGGMTGGMPMLANAARGMGAPTAHAPRFGFRPTFVQQPVYAG